jgi:hypothetical protein
VALSPLDSSLAESTNRVPTLVTSRSFFLSLREQEIQPELMCFAASAVERRAAIRYPRDLDDRAMRGIVGRSDGGGYGGVCRGQARLSRQVSPVEERGTEPRHLQPGVQPARPGPIPQVLPEIRHAFRQNRQRPSSRSTERPCAELPTRLVRAPLCTWSAPEAATIA